MRNAYYHISSKYLLHELADSQEVTLSRGRCAYGRESHYSRPSNIYENERSVYS